jgi:hypothetical protein
MESHPVRHLYALLVAHVHPEHPHCHNCAEALVVLQGAGDITYSIVRPTAFFKSLAGQVSDMFAGWASSAASAAHSQPAQAWHETL